MYGGVYRLYAFEAVGLLLGQEELAAEEQQRYLSALLQPLIQQVEANLPLCDRPPPGPQAPQPAALVQQSMEAISRISKGFSLSLCTRSVLALTAACGIF